MYIQLYYDRRSRYCKHPYRPINSYHFSRFPRNVIAISPRKNIYSNSAVMVCGKSNEFSALKREWNSPRHISIHVIVFRPRIRYWTHSFSKKKKKITRLLKHWLAIWFIESVDTPYRNGNGDVTSQARRRVTLDKISCRAFQLFNWSTLFASRADTSVRIQRF